MLVNQFPDRTVLVENKKYLYFGGTSYLGLPTHPKFQKKVAQNIKKWGTSYGSSRSANIQLAAYEESEQALANFIQSEAAVTVSSGMLAGKILLEILLQKSSACYYFPNVHAALQTKESLPFYVKNGIHPSLTNSQKETIILVTDSYPTSHVHPIDLKAITQISPFKEIILVVDESHSLGITGKNGSGEFSNIQIPNIHSKIMIASLGKALGVTGGLIAGDCSLIQEVKNHPSFVCAAGMNPAFLSALASALPLVQKRHKKLMRNLHFLNTLLPTDAPVAFNPNYPLLYPHASNFHEKCLANAIVVVDFPYNTPTGSLNRVVITANHKKKDLQRLAGILQV